MNKKICAILFSILSFSSTFAHGTLVHQHMVREAYKLLKHYVGQDIREMKDHVGYNEEGSGQFNPGGKIVIGAYQEDYSDATNEGYGFAGWFVTCTHFWDPDQGDNSTFNYEGNSYSNAYQKARKYLYGGYELRVPYPANQITEAYNAPPNLFQFYKDGIIFYKGYYNIAGQFVPRNRWCSVSKDFRNKVVWEILGRICHLLGDMTVPAHTHNDPHPPGNRDTYEEWMNNGLVYNTWTVNDAIAQGGLINPTSSGNPLKFLFYPTAQTTNFFNTFDADGNNGSGINDPFALYPGLNEKITELTNFYRGTAPTKNYVVALEYCANQTFALGIRSMAGLLYLFAKEADLLPMPMTGVTVTGTDILYQGATGIWGATAQNGLEPFTYSWQIKYVDGGGYLQSFASVKAEKEKKEKDKKKDGDIIIALAPSNEWVPLYVNSDVLTRPHNPTDLRDYYLKCSVTDASGTTKTSNEWFVDVTADPPPVNPPQTNTLSADDLKSEMNALSKETEVAETPNAYSLEQNYPNPFNPTTRISYSIAESGFVTLKVFDILGREVSTLVNEVKPAGRFEVEFNASELPTGTYIYRLTAGNYQTINKMLLLK